MKKANKFLLAVVVIAASLLSSCGKYEDGPGFSLLTKKQRLCRSWLIKSITVGSVTVEGDSDDDDYFTFKKNGDYSTTSGNVTQTGTWAFTNDKEDVTVTMGGDSETYKIRRLTNKELWVSSTDPDSGTEVIMKAEAKE